MKKLSRGEALAELHRRGMTPFAGGDGTGTVIRAGEFPVEPAYPLGRPTVNQSTGVVDVPRFLREPTRITRVIQDMSLEQFIFDELFTSGGGVTGGAVVYDVPDENDLYADRDIQRIEPGAEFPLITTSVTGPRTAYVEKWGAKTFITDEARDRNDGVLFAQELRKMTNTIVRKLNQRAVETIEAVFTEFPGQVIPGNNWTAVTTLGTNPTAYSLQPVGDLVDLQLFLDAQEQGMVHDTLLMNPQERARLQLIYGQEWQAVLREYGYGNVRVSRRVTAGTMYSIARGQLGELRIEKPLGTETWREQKTERTFVQASVRPLLFVRNPYAVIKVTGLAG